MRIGAAHQAIEARSNLAFGKKSCRVKWKHSQITYIAYRTIGKKSGETHYKWEQAFRRLKKERGIILSNNT